MPHVRRKRLWIGGTPEAHHRVALEFVEETPHHPAVLTERRVVEMRIHDGPGQIGCRQRVRHTAFGERHGCRSRAVALDVAAFLLRIHGHGGADAAAQQHLPADLARPVRGGVYVQVEVAAHEVAYIHRRLPTNTRGDPDTPSRLAEESCVAAYKSS